MRSMTGFGKAEYKDNNFSLTVEIKTVNNRIFDFNIKAPRSFLSFEDGIRQAVISKVNRGRIDLFINFSDKRENTSISVDEGRAVAYFNASKIIAEKTGLPNDCTVSGLMKCPDVLLDGDPLSLDDFEPIIIKTVLEACDKLNEMRDIEGKKISLDMLSRMDTINSLVLSIKERAPFVAKEYKEKLKNRITEALADVKYDEARLLNEVAFYTDKVNIDEEITRLFSHINQFKSIIEGENIGKKLDFLMQEFNRETNTICSKSNDLTITNFALSLKNEIEKVREQVQNLE